MDKQGRRSLLIGSYAGMVRPFVVNFIFMVLPDLLVSLNTFDHLHRNMPSLLRSFLDYAFYSFAAE